MNGLNIRKLREDRNISREQMVDYLGISLRTYQKIESNQREPTIAEINKIAEKLDVTPEELLFGEPKVIFEKCNKGFYSLGTMLFQSIEEVKQHYESLLSQKGALIKSLQDALDFLTK